MAETKNAVFKIFIRGTAEAVWRELTKTHEPQAPMFNMILHTDGIKPGGQMRMRTVNGKYTGVVGEILECDPPRRYAHTFKFTNYDDAPCTMVYEIHDVEGGVEFVLRAEGIPVGTKTAKDILRGGNMIVKTMKAVVETGKPSFGTRAMYTMFKLMEPFSPKKTRSEHWPLAH